MRESDDFDFTRIRNRTKDEAQVRNSLAVSFGLKLCAIVSFESVFEARSKPFAPDECGLYRCRNRIDRRKGRVSIVTQAQICEIFRNMCGIDQNPWSFKYSPQNRDCNCRSCFSQTRCPQRPALTPCIAFPRRSRTRP